MKILLAILMMCVLVSCATEQTQIKSANLGLPLIQTKMKMVFDDPQKLSKTKSVDEEEKEWSKIDPLMFLEILRKHPKTTVWIYEAPLDWVKEEHISRLIEMIDSKEEATIVCAFINAHFPPKNTSSTIGKESMRLIKSFKEASRYPGSCSDIDNSVNPDEIRKWWQQTKKEPAI